MQLTLIEEVILRLLGAIFSFSDKSFKAVFAHTVLTE